jgi:DNA helicase-4
MASRLDRWVSLMRMHGGSQAEMIAGAPEEVRDLFGKRVKLMAPLMKAWKTALKAENAVDFSGLIHQAVNILDKGRFVSPWKHILVDEFQDISPQRASLLAALRRQNSQTTLFAVGDDWQAIYRFSGAQLSLTTAFNHYFGEGDCCALDTTYRFNGRIGEIANGFIQQNPHQLSKPLNSLTAGDKKAVTLLADDKLDDLLDKLSGYVKPEQRILLLARYHHLKPEALEKAATRWPHLQLDFMTIHASKGQQADYVIVLGLQEGMMRFRPRRVSRLWSRRCCRSRRIFRMRKSGACCMSLSPARGFAWLLFNKAQPSPFVEMLEAGCAGGEKP